MSVGTATQVDCISFPDCDTGYASMDNSTMRKTVNGGLNWTSCTVPANPNLEIDFPTGQRGFMVCFHGVSMTTDGAQTWTPVVTNNALDFCDVTFVTPAIGYASGLNVAMDSAFIYKTTNGGSTWTLLPVFGPQANIFEPRLYFYSATLGFMNGDGCIYRTTDGGMTWTNVYTDPNSGMWVTMHSPDGINFYESGYYGDFVASTNSGASWTQGVLLSNPCYGLYFTSASHGFQCGGNGISTGSVEETNDGGATWNSVYNGNTLWCMDFVSNTCGYAAGTGGVIVKYSGPMAVTETTAPRFTCYPNPANDFFTIRNIAAGSHITITNSLGDIIEERDAAETQETFYLDIPGVYFINVINERGMKMTEPIVVQ